MRQNHTKTMATLNREFDTNPDTPANPNPQNTFFTWSKRSVIKGVALWSVGLVTYFALAMSAGLAYDTFPSAKPATTVVTEFSEARPLGSNSNRVQTLNYIVSQLEDIKNKTGRLTWSVRNNKGNHSTFSALGVPRAFWSGINNVVAEIPGIGTNRSKFLVSAHYDTVTLSPGAFDDTSGISVMLEIAHVISNLPPAENDLLLLFNNGEEIGLFGSVDFAVFDPLWTNVSGFINLDSTPGTKNILFRSTGGNIDYEWRKIPRPLGSVVAADFFKLRLLSSETDFSVFIDPLKTYKKHNNSNPQDSYTNSADGRPGLDFAFFDNRQSYHTMKDTKVRSGALQCLGDNVVDFLRRILEKQNLRDYLLNSQGDNVYFSVLEGFAVVYPMPLHYILNVTLAVALVLLVISSCFFQYRWWLLSSTKRLWSSPLIGTLTNFAKIILASLSGIIFSVLVGFLLGTYRPLFYYRSSILGVLVFVCSTMTGICGTLFLFAWKEHGDKDSESIDDTSTSGEDLFGDVVFMSRDRNRVKDNSVTTSAQFVYPFLASSLFWTFLVCLMLPLSKKWGSTYLAVFPGLVLTLVMLAHVIFEIVQHVSWKKTASKPAEGTSKSGNSFAFLPERDTNNEDDDENKRLIVGTNQIEEKVTGLVEETKYLIFYSVIFFVFSYFGLILLFDFLAKIILSLNSTQPALIFGGFISFITVICFVSFYPLAKRANTFGSATIFFVLFTIILIFVASFMPLYSSDQPWTVYPNNIISLSGNGTGISGAPTTNLMAFTSTVHEGNLEKLIKDYFNTNSTVECSDNLSKGILWYLKSTAISCTWNISLLPNISFLRYNIVPLNVTLGTGALVEVESPGAYVHAVQVNTTQLCSVYVGDNFVVNNSTSVKFGYILTQQEQLQNWNITIFCDQLQNVSVPNNIFVTINSNYDDLAYSPSIQQVIKYLPEWATFTGTGSGLTRVTTPISFTLSEDLGVGSNI